MKNWLAIVLLHYGMCCAFPCLFWMLFITYEHSASYMDIPKGHMVRNDALLMYCSSWDQEHVQ